MSIIMDILHKCLGYKFLLNLTLVCSTIPSSSMKIVRCSVLSSPHLGNINT
ncbi:hypothetical protein ACHAW6_002037 [Cyclotella cf. meneghiniana]